MLQQPAEQWSTLATGTRMDLRSMFELEEAAANTLVGLEKFTKGPVQKWLRAESKSIPIQFVQILPFIYFRVASVYEAVLIVRRVFVFFLKNLSILTVNLEVHCVICCAH